MNYTAPHLLGGLRLLVLGLIFVTASPSFSQEETDVAEQTDTAEKEDIDQQADAAAVSKSDSSGGGQKDGASDGQSADEPELTTKEPELTPEEKQLTKEEIEQFQAQQAEFGAKAKEQFNKVKQEYVEAMIEMRVAQILFMNEGQSDDAGERYRELRNESRQKMNELFEAGLEVIRAIGDPEVGTFMVTMLQHRFEHGYYDELTTEAGARLIDGGIRLTYVFLVTARSAMAIGDIELAKRLYESLEEDDLEDIDKQLIFRADVIGEEADQEKEIRAVEAEAGTNPRVLMKTTRGDVLLELFIDQAPSTVANFLWLVNEKRYYDGLDFFQVMDHLLALTGDDSGNGSGGSGKFLIDEHERKDARSALAGSLVMAKRPVGTPGDFIPNSASAQFSILFLPLPHVTKQQVVFGRVIEGMDVISELRRVDPTKKKKKTDIVVPPDRVLSMEVVREPKTMPEIEYLDTRAALEEAMRIRQQNQP